VMHADVKHPIRADLFIDDKIDHVVEWQAENPEGTAFLWGTPHNVKDVWSRRLVAWDGLFQAIEAAREVGGG
jgi:5'(3')-deoxyribonucleotidase